MSKSGLFAHFGSKEELQLATIEPPRTIFRPTCSSRRWPSPRGCPAARRSASVPRPRGPGASFPAGASSPRRRPSSTPVPARCGTASPRSTTAWIALLEDSVRRAQELGQLDPSLDPEQLVFEVNAMLAEANGIFLLRADPRVFGMARRAIGARLGDQPSIRPMSVVEGGVAPVDAVAPPRERLLGEGEGGIGGGMRRRGHDPGPGRGVERSCRPDGVARGREVDPLAKVAPGPVEVPPRGGAHRREPAELAREALAVELAERAAEGDEPHVGGQSAGGSCRRVTARTVPWLCAAMMIRS